MRQQVTKRYAKAFIEVYGIKKIDTLMGGLLLLKDAFRDEKFVDVVSTRDASDEKKKELIKHVSGIKDKDFSRFLDVLFAEKRVMILSEMYDCLNEHISSENREYKATISSNIKLTKAKIDEIKKRLDKKLGAKVTINENIDTSFDGIKLYVDILNVEISLSREGIKRKLSEMILKQI